MKIILIVLVVIIVVGIIFYLKNPSTQPITSSTSTPTTATPSVKAVFQYAFPIDNFFSRLTKKPFGIYITPKNSPVQPEKFTGFHTGVDIEYSDIAGEVKVYAIANGQVIHSGWVSGYGGFLAVQHTTFISVYGHLNPGSLPKNGSIVKKGQQIGILGDAFSTQTDGERQHLHFGIIKGHQLDFRGYVQNQSELSLWLDPVTLFQ
jgi:murein DD-endopeptidase MepM/ murein hydrolase activator NlpD